MPKSRKPSQELLPLHPASPLSASASAINLSVPTDMSELQGTGKRHGLFSRFKRKHRRAGSDHSVPADTPRKKSDSMLHPLDASPGEEMPPKNVSTYFETRHLNHTAPRRVSPGAANSLTVDMATSPKKPSPDNFLQLDQNFSAMEGIVHADQGATPITSSASLWAPPDSWAVENTAFDDDDIDDDIDDLERSSFADTPANFQVKLPSYFIRIFKPDNTFATLQVPLNTTSKELLQRVAGKFFLHDLNKYRILLRHHGMDRQLLPSEYPLMIQKKLLEQMGYTDDDNIEDVGREDNSYLFRFIFGPKLPENVNEADLMDVQHVGLQSHNLSTVPIALYAFAANIITLDLSRNLLMELPVDFLHTCTQLTQLWLMENEYTQLPASLAHIPHLQHLNVSSNRLTDLDTLPSLQPQLVSLRAFNNQIRTLPDDLATCCHNLSLLYLSNNALAEFPLAICSLSTLQYLDISFNRIAQLPPEIGQLENLVALYAIGNRLTGALPDEMVHLVQLQDLDLRQNLLTEIDVLCQLPKLQALAMDYNAITIVSSDIANIRHLQLAKNHLTQFNLGFCQPPEDAAYYYGQSPLYTVHTQLTELNLANCKLPSLPDDIFSSMASLQRLILDNNTLTVLPHTVGLLTNLIYLSVQDNVLNALPSSIGNLKELKVLLAQKNNMQHVPKEIWLCASLQTLNCSSNLLDGFPEAFNDILPVMPGTSAAAASASAAAAAAAACASAGTSTPSSSPASTPRGSQQVSVSRRASPLHTTMVHSSGSGSTSTYQQSPLHQHHASIGSDRVMTSSTRENSYEDGGDYPPQMQVPTFNPPSFFTSPRNHPPPLSLSLRHLLLADNRLTDDIWSPLALFLELRVLNLSYNELYEIPPDGLCHQHLYELYLSGNALTSLPADDVEKLTYLRILAVNDNKLLTLPAEIGKLRKLLVLDVGNNVLKYNIANWPYDWNWNWNLGLHYLNLSGNKRLEIKRMQPASVEFHGSPEHHLCDFAALTELRTLGLMDITILGGVSMPEESPNCRVRTTPSEVNAMGYGVADWIGDQFACWDLVLPRFRNKDDECLFALFQGRYPDNLDSPTTPYYSQQPRPFATSSSTMTASMLHLSSSSPYSHYHTQSSSASSMHPHHGPYPMPSYQHQQQQLQFQQMQRSVCHLAKSLSDQLPRRLTIELEKASGNDSVISALRRTFLCLEKELGAGANGDEELPRDLKTGVTAAVCYITGSKLYVANVGDVVVVVSRNHGQSHVISQKHIPLNPGEAARIRNCGGYVSNQGLLNDQVGVSRSFGYFHLVPVIDANPFVSVVDLTESDEFVIVASAALWETMSYQTAVDIARTEAFDMMLAAQKLRDFALGYGASHQSLLVMVIGISDLVNGYADSHRKFRHPPSPFSSRPSDEDGTVPVKSKRRGKEIAGDSTLARLDREVPPPVNQVALVFTDIKNSTFLWEAHQEDMRSAIKLHDTIMRRTLRSVGGYEVKTEGDAFMACFQHITSALLWCFTVQLQLLEADWPAGLLDTDEGREIEDKDGNLIYRGLSVRMGIHWGTPVFERNPITNRMDYFGPVVNKASRICNAADGGQICVSSDVISTLRHLRGGILMKQQQQMLAGQGGDGDQDDAEYGELHLQLGASGIQYLTRDIQQIKRLGFQVMELGERRLKGLETPEILSLVYPKQLAGRMDAVAAAAAAAAAHDATAPVLPAASLIDTASDHHAPHHHHLVSSPLFKSSRSSSSSQASSTKSLYLDDDTVDDQARQQLQVARRHAHYHKSASPATLPILTAVGKRASSITSAASTSTARSVRAIHPSFVCALSNLTIRLERITTGVVVPKSTTVPDEQRVSHIVNPDGSTFDIVIPEFPSRRAVRFVDAVERHMMETSSDEELIILMENFVTRLENVVASLYLQKVGRFADVLEKLGDALTMDPQHISHALQIYSEISGLSEHPLYKQV
ncbi:hypothetical protein BC940DRAFT_261979 [Gongronella butleri]|nr:hypothetical protein BC940DRAFT_261979 [Gongronella butleri]